MPKKPKEPHIMAALKRMPPDDVKEFIDDNSSFVGQVVQLMKQIYGKSRIHYLARKTIFANMANAHGFIEVDKNFFVDRTKAERFKDLLKNARFVSGPDLSGVQ